MKTLLVSIDDGIYRGYSVATLDVSVTSIEMVSLSEQVTQALDKVTLWGSEESEVTELLSKYDAVIVCNNGAIYKLK